MATLVSQVFPKPKWAKLSRKPPSAARSEAQPSGVQKDDLRKAA